VPAVDMVAFIDPRRSRVDIAQATGRAMRKPRGLNKEFGYAVIPLFLDRRSGETLEEALERSEFDEVADVLNAMQEQDADLVQIIRELQEATGRGEIFDPRRLSGKIEVLGPSIELSALRVNIGAEIVNAIGVSWDEWYGRLTLYKNREGHCRVPQSHKENGFRLGHWVNIQRTNENLSEERRQRLDKLGFVWDALAAAWEAGLLQLRAYKEREGHCYVSPRYISADGYRLGQWVSVQRSWQDRLSDERKARLDALGFDWAPRDTAWEKGLHLLRAYKEREGHCRVPNDYVENGFRLGIWVVNKRKAESLSAIRRQQLDDLGFVWDVFEADWEEGFSYLTVYKDREGHCRVPTDHKENGFPVGQWVARRRQRAESLSAIRRQQLDDLGFVWDVFEADWEEGFSYLTVYKNREGHCRVPPNHVENGFRLEGWIATQRSRKDKLSEERRKRLDELGFIWNPREADWEEGFSYLKAYKEREGHCRVPGEHIENGFRLGQWVGVQRTYNENLSQQRRAQLEELEFVWDPFTADWEEGFSYLKVYNEREGHCRVPYKHVENGFRLGPWITKQRLRKSALSEERCKRLDELGFVWGAREAKWEEGFSYLTAYKDREGHCRVPKDHAESGFRLGQWVGVQRGFVNLPDERRQRLSGLGFVWDTHEAAWEEGFSYLKAYKEREGHCQVPYKHVENSFRLGGWVDTQRQWQRKGRMSQERLQRLNELGFVWDARRAALVGSRE
jgi:ribosomal protein L7Ae-like RNA K-turn-binding protein